MAADYVKNGYLIKNEGFVFVKKVTCVCAETYPKGFIELPWFRYQNISY